MCWDMVEGETGYIYRFGILCLNWPDCTRCLGHRSDMAYTDWIKLDFQPRSVVTIAQRPYPRGIMIYFAVLLPGDSAKEANSPRPHHHIAKSSRIHYYNVDPHFGAIVVRDPRGCE